MTTERPGRPDDGDTDHDDCTDRPGRRRVRFTVDGQRYTTDDRTQPARAILELAGLAADTFDLTRVRRKGQVERFDDDETVTIRPGDDFLSLRCQATVA